MNAAGSETGLETTSLQDNGKIQLTKRARQALEKHHGKLPKKALLRWYDPGNGDLILRYDNKTD